ncbi:MAG: PCRF domain-containing protein, partial [Patescibacteria group bacterium]
MPKEIAALELKTQDPDIWSDQKAANELFARLKILKKQWEPVSELAVQVRELEELTKASEVLDLPDLRKEYEKLETHWKTIETQIYLSEEFDGSNCYLTVSGGAGGTEAQDWAAMLLRMYLRY